jgi:putative membrane protein
MIQLVSRLVSGFTVPGFWTAFFASIFLSVFSFILSAFLLGGSSSHPVQMPHSGMWL